MPNKCIHTFWALNESSYNVSFLCQSDPTLPVIQIENDKRIEVEEYVQPEHSNSSQNNEGQ